MRRPSVNRSILAAVVAIALTVGVAACGNSSSDSGRSASTDGCIARFGCADRPTRFQVRNDTSAPMKLVAENVINVSDKDLAGLVLDVPAHSTSPVIAVRLGDDGIEAYGHYIEGGYRGAWTWNIDIAGSRVVANVELAMNDDLEMLQQPYESWSEIGAKAPLYDTSRTTPVDLTSQDGKVVLAAVGSHAQYYPERTDYTATWTFGPASS